LSTLLHENLPLFTGETFNIEILQNGSILSG
jgi:hypothetical protein